MQILCFFCLFKFIPKYLIQGCYKRNFLNVIYRLLLGIHFLKARLTFFREDSALVDFAVERLGSTPEASFTSVCMSCILLSCCV